MKRIAEKSKLINLPPATPPVPRQAPPPARQPGERSAADGIASATANPPSGSGSTSRSFTGVGAMMAALGQGGTLGRELEEVKARLAEFEGSIPVRLLDPKLIRPGRFANRHQTEYGSPAFLELKREIEQARLNYRPA